MVIEILKIIREKFYFNLNIFFKYWEKKLLKCYSKSFSEVLKKKKFFFKRKYRESKTWLLLIESHFAINKWKNKKFRTKGRRKYWGRKEKCGKK